MKPSAKRSKILIFIIIVLLIFSLNLFSKEARNFFYSISAPVQRSLWQAGDSVSDFFSGIFGAKNLKKENEELKLENQGLLAENMALRGAREENEILRKALGIGLEDDFELAFARVIAKDANRDSVLINKGSRDGLAKSMAVITQEKVLLGKISDVYEDFSRVALISNKESSFDAEISEKNLAGVVRGKGGLELYLDLIPRDKEVKKGDLVISTAFGGVYPEGLLIGLVEETKRTDVQPFQQAEIAPFFDIQELENVFVILSF